LSKCSGLGCTVNLIHTRKTQAIFAIEAADKLALKLLEYDVDEIIFVVGILFFCKHGAFLVCFSIKTH
jgi:hypothetical protein